MPLILAPLALLLAAQTTPVPALPKGTGLPPPASEDAAVMAPINAVFAAFEAGDGQAMLRHVDPAGRVIAVGPGPDGVSNVRRTSFTDFATKLTPAGAFSERISDPAIEIDGDVAMVWAPFTVRVGGKVVSCGYDHFDMIRESGAWKIAGVTYSSRKTGCES